MAATAVGATLCSPGFCCRVARAAWKQSRVQASFACLYKQNSRIENFPAAGSSIVWRQVAGDSGFCKRHISQGFRRGVSMQAEAGTSGSGDSGALAKKKCVPCEGKNVKALEKEAAEELLHEVPGWELLTEGEFKLKREWKTKNFVKGLEFMEKIGDIAEQEGHHPDLHLVGWNKLSVEINTHSIGGLSENDFILAAKINEVDADDFLRKKKSIASS